MISIVTITYNNCSELKKSIESIRGLNGIESVVINGGSSQDSFDYLSHHFGFVLNEKDDGISDAFNKGLRHSNGDAISFLNSGDLLLDRYYYQWADELFKSDPNIDFVYSNIIFVAPSGKELLMKPRGAVKADLGKGMPYPHPSMVVRREIFEKIGGFSKNYKIAMDFDFAVRLLAAGYRGIYYPHATVKMDGGGVSSVKEFQGISECRASLVEHDLFHGKIASDFKFRLLKYRVRGLVLKLLGNRSLILLKSLKSKLK